MKTKLVPAILLAGLILSACVSIAPVPGAGNPAATPQPTKPAGPGVTPTSTPQDPAAVPTVPAGVARVLAAVAAERGVTPGALSIVRWGAVEWPDSCLGMNVSERPCLQVITPGYLIVVELNGTEIEVHSNQDGSAYAVVPPQGIPDPAATPAFIAELSESLASELGIADVKMLRLADFEAVQWPDSCLGVRSGKPCLAVITPGYRLWFKVNERLYEVHTNEDGSQHETMQNELPAFAMDLRGSVAQQLGLSLPEVKLVRGEKVEWPDACLGISDPQVMCAQVITPGYNLVYLAGGKEVEVHTNADGTQWKLAPAA